MNKFLLKNKNCQKLCTFIVNYPLKMCVTSIKQWLCTESFTQNTFSFNNYSRIRNYLMYNANFFMLEVVTLNNEEIYERGVFSDLHQYASQRANNKLGK